MGNQKNIVINFRATDEEKREIDELAEQLSIVLPFMCRNCGARFTIEEERKFNGKCPYCNGKIERAQVTRSQVIRYAWRFLRTIELAGFSMYDVFRELIADMEFRKSLIGKPVNIDVNGSNALTIFNNFVRELRDELEKYPFSRISNRLYIRAIDSGKEIEYAIWKKI